MLVVVLAKEEHDKNTPASSGPRGLYPYSQQLRGGTYKDLYPVHCTELSA